MNERINILAEQAGLHCDGTPDCWDQEAIARFAQLIVRECMKCSDPLVSHYINTHTEQEQAPLLAAIADYSSEIKKHFGVEE